MRFSLRNPLEPVQDLLRHPQVYSGSARNPHILHVKLVIAPPTAIHGLVRFLRSARTQLTATRNDLEQVLRTVFIKVKLPESSEFGSITMTGTAILVTVLALLYFNSNTSLG